MIFEEKKKLLHQIYEQYYDDVYRYARYLLGNREEALDAVQEVYERAFHSIDRFEGRSSPKTWLLAIARNYSVDWLRKHGGSSSSQNIQSLGISDPTDAIDTKILLEAALQQLRPNYRQVFVLRYMLDMSIKDTAHILHWSESKVRTTLHRATIELRSLLNENDSPKGGASNGI